MLNQSEFADICSREGIAIADPSLGIGRELTYLDNPARTIVVHFIESDFPDIWKSTMKCVLRHTSIWILANRYGTFRAQEFPKPELDSLLELLVKSYPAVSSEGDDQYLVAKDGDVIISYDHHMFDDGLAVYTNDVKIAGSILACLNELGAEVELFSKNG